MNVAARTSQDNRPPDAPAWRDRSAAVLMGLAAVSALVAAAAGVGELADAGDDTRVVEVWRLYGFVMFAGLFALLARWPRQSRGVWELVIFHKFALTVTALAWLPSDVSGAGAVVVSDGALTVILVASYILTRAWTAWTRGAPDPSVSP